MLRVMERPPNRWTEDLDLDPYLVRPPSFTDVVSCNGTNLEEVGGTWTWVRLTRWITCPHRRAGESCLLGRYRGGEGRNQCAGTPCAHDIVDSD